jgi:hypothetical protein
MAEKNSFPLQLSLQKINSAILIIAGGLLVYLAILILTTPFYLNRIMKSASLNESGALQTLPDLKDFAYYQNVLSEHSLFGVMKQKIEAPVKSPCDEFKSKYTLNGVIGGIENEALFNSRSGQQSYYAKAGEVIEGVTIQQIGSGSVTLECSGQQSEMMIEEI